MNLLSENCPTSWTRLRAEIAGTPRLPSSLSSSAAGSPSQCSSNHNRRYRWWTSLVLLAPVLVSQWYALRSRYQLQIPLQKRSIVIRAFKVEYVPVEYLMNYTISLTCQGITRSTCLASSPSTQIPVYSVRVETHPVGVRESIDSWYRENGKRERASICQFSWGAAPLSVSSMCSRYVMRPNGSRVDVVNSHHHHHHYQHHPSA